MNISSPSVKFLSDRKHACPMDPIDRSDHLTFATYIVAEPPAQALYFATA